MPPIWFKRAYRGLYGNRTIQFGNQVSFAGNKKRRTWKPNVQTTTLYSVTLGEKFKTRATTYAMRCIRKAGGIDEYLLKTKDSEIKYPRALRFKQRIIEARRQNLKNATTSGSSFAGTKSDVLGPGIISKTPVTGGKTSFGPSKGLAEL